MRINQCHSAVVHVVLLDSLVQVGHLAEQVADDQVGKAGQFLQVVARLAAQPPQP